MKNVICIAPHPDDETLGCGGTLLKHRENGDRIFWIIMTTINESLGLKKERILERKEEIAKVNKMYGFEKHWHLEFVTTQLDTYPIGEVVGKLASIFKEVSPEIIYLPFPGDIHSDHASTFESAAACTKWFRYPSVKKVLSYEVMSETEFGINPQESKFSPNCFFDISNFFHKKIEIMKQYKGEMGEFPFPRSEQALEALAKYRGAAIGTQYAEAFMILKEIN